MKTSISDPWTNGENISPRSVSEEGNYFEDCFVDNKTDETKLPDSEQYLQSLYSKLRAVQGGSSKKDLVNSLTAVKEDCIARLLTDGCKPQSEEESELAANPLVRHIAPHLQALTAGELVQLLKADVLQAVTDEQHDEQPASE